MPTDRTMRPRQLTAVLAIGLLAAVLIAPALAAPPLKVTSATPSEAEVETINLDVEISGSGFAQGATASFYRTGTSDPGGVVVNSTTYLSGKKLRANIDLPAGTSIDLYDIEVELLSTRRGKGVELFSVKEKTTGPPQAAPLINPAYMYLLGERRPAELRLALSDLSDTRTLHDAATWPVWYPDGQAIAFVTPDTPESPPECGAIYRIDADGENLTLVCDLVDPCVNHCGGREPRFEFSPDGQWMVFPGKGSANDCNTGNQEIFALHLPSCQLTQLTDYPDRAAANSPAWSPIADLDPATPGNQSQIAYSTYCQSQLGPGCGDWDLVILDVETDDFGNITVGATTPLTDTGTRHEIQPDWSPDGELISFLNIALDAGDDPEAYYTIRADGSAPAEQLAPVGWLGYGPASWSPDGQYLVFAQKYELEKRCKGATLGYDLFRVRADGTDLTNLTKIHRCANAESWADWSPAWQNDLD